MVGEKLLDSAEGRVMCLGDGIMKSRTARKRMGQRFRLCATQNTHGTRSFAPMNQARLGRELIGDSTIEGAGGPRIDLVQDSTKMVPPHTFTEEEFSSAGRIAFCPGNMVAANGASPSLLNRFRHWTEGEGVRYRVYNICSGFCEASAKLRSKGW